MSSDTFKRVRFAGQRNNWSVVTIFAPPTLFQVGALPRSLGGLQHLQGLYLYSNHFTGSIPEEVLLLPSLTGIYLYNNHFSSTKMQ